MDRFFAHFYLSGKFMVNVLSDFGNYCLFCYRLITMIPKSSIKKIVEQMFKIGTKSLPITGITLLFVGMVFTNQVTKEFAEMGAIKMIGGIVGFAFWRELGPLFAGVVVASRVGAAISTEIAAMKVTEQLSALRSMAMRPDVYLYIPRLVALVLMMPILIIFANAVGFLSGLLIYGTIYRGNPVAYFVSAGSMLGLKDMLGGILLKGPVFGFIIASVACYIGSQTGSGAEGIGKAATKTVVICLLSLFIVNFFLSLLIF